MVSRSSRLKRAPNPRLGDIAAIVVVHEIPTLPEGAESLHAALLKEAADVRGWNAARAPPPGKMKLRPDSKLVIMGVPGDADARMRAVKGLLQELEATASVLA